MARFFDGERAAAHHVTPELTKDELLLRTADGSTLMAWPIRQIVTVDAWDLRYAVAATEWSAGAVDRQRRRTDATLK